MVTLLIGARGQLGSDLLKLNRGEFLPWTSEDVDLMDLHGLEKKLQSTSFQAIVNCAAFNKTELAELEPLKAYTINGHAVGVMAKVAESKNVPFFHFSTDYVFGGEKRSPYIEEDLTAPLSIYGASKALGESLALSLCSKAYVFRTASLFGVSGSREKKGNFVDSIVLKGKNGDPIQVVEDIWMSPTATSDLAKILLYFLENLPLPGIYHAINQGGASWYTFAQEIGRKFGFLDRIEPVSQNSFPSKIRRPAYSVMAHQKILNVLAVRPWEEALSEYLHTKYFTE